MIDVPTCPGVCGTLRFVDALLPAVSSARQPLQSEHLSSPRRMGESLEIVERFGIMVQDPLLGFLAELCELLESHNGVRVAGRVQMPVVCPDNEAPLPGVLEDPGEVIVCLTGHIDLVRSEHILGELPACRLVAVTSFMINPRHPLRGRFDKPPPQCRKDARQFAHEQHVAGNHGGTTKYLEPAAKQPFRPWRRPPEVTI